MQASPSHVGYMRNIDSVFVHGGSRRGNILIAVTATHPSRRRHRDGGPWRESCVLYDGEERVPILSSLPLDLCRFFPALVSADPPVSITSAQLSTSVDEAIHAYLFDGDGPVISGSTVLINVYDKFSPTAHLLSQMGEEEVRELLALTGL